jgi:hypothetical protein
VNLKRDKVRISSLMIAYGQKNSWSELLSLILLNPIIRPDEIHGKVGRLWHGMSGFCSIWDCDVILVTIDHLIGEQSCIIGNMAAKRKRALEVRCPTCGAKVGEKCELGTGQPRTEPHRDRRLVSAKK